MGSRGAERVPDVEQSTVPDRSDSASSHGTGEESGQHKLLVLDTSYTFEMIRSRGLEDSVTCRDLGGFFEHVWTVHPFATLLTSPEWAPKYGRPVTHLVSGRHTFIEGKVGRYRWLNRLFAPNFLIGQFSLFLKLVSLIRRERIGVVRVGDPLYLGLLGWALSRTCRIPFVIRVGGNNDKVFETTGQPLQPRLLRSRRIEKVVERFVFPRADLVAGANQNNLDFALANGARPERSTLFRYGNLIDRRHFASPTQRPGGETVTSAGVEAGKFLVYVGRLEPVKHPDHVVRVLAAALAAGLDVKALLIGDGTMRPALSRLAAELGVGDQLRMPGNQDQGWLSAILPRAALVVSPHTGRALSEAALAAAPVVAYDIDWQGELIETDRTGILVPYNDISSLSEAAVALLKDPPRARILGDALRKRALEMLDPAVLDEHERQEYRKLLVRTPHRLARPVARA